MKMNALKTNIVALSGLTPLGQIPHKNVFLTSWDFYCMKTALLRTGAATEVSHYCEFGQRSVKGYNGFREKHGTNKVYH